jgi:inositol phosphorylceramide mannosyltransferase catalytic subunit
MRCNILYYINCILFIIIIIINFIFYRSEQFNNNDKNIPTKIHQIWIGPKKKPDIYLKTWSVDYINRFKDWEYILWDDNKIDELFRNIQSKFNINILKKIYDSEKTYHGKADIARLLILYVYGGIYIDADSVWINDKNLVDIINMSKKTGMFAAYEPNKNFITNGVVGSTKHNNNILFLLNKLIKMEHDYDSIRKKQPPWVVTGPLLLNNITKSITKLDSIYFYPISWHGIKDKELHKKIKLPKESYMFQYGMTTNNLDV